MIPCICIDDDYRPERIPLSKWVKEGEVYHIIYTTHVTPQNIIGVHLAEINLTEDELPYEYFNIKRFAFNAKHLQQLKKLIRDCAEADDSVNNLLNQIKSNEPLSNDRESDSSGGD